MMEALILRHDASEFEALAHDEMVLIPPGGIIESKEEVIAGLRAFSLVWRLDHAPAGRLGAASARHAPDVHRMIAKLAAALPMAELASFPGAGHIPHITHPDFYVEVTRSFIRTHTM